MLQRWGHARRCQRRARHCSNSVIANYLEACAVLEPNHPGNTPMIAVDLELTGLDHRKDRIIAIGWTLIDEGKIRFGSNRQVLISTGRSVGSSAEIHEILDSELAGGERIEQGLEDLFRAGTSRLWLFHHARLDLAFLRAAVQAWTGTRPGFIVLDTLDIEKRQRLRRNVPTRQGQLQLGRLRSEYRLPPYPGHNALNDAIATAELALAMAARAQSGGALDLRRYHRYC
jgi:DNA polymerase-3 subunit epsilon